MGPRDPVIVGIGLSDYPHRAAPLDALSTTRRRCSARSPTAGLAKRAIDGYLLRGHGRRPGARPWRWPSTSASTIATSTRTMTGGSSFEFHVQHAAAAIREGLCETVLVTYGSNFLSRARPHARHRRLRRPRRARDGRRHVPGALRPLAGRRLRAWSRAGTCTSTAPTSEQLAEIAVGVREFAGLNPNAMYRDPITRRGRAREPHDRRPAAPARLLRRHRRRRRVHHDHGRARPRPAPARGARARRGRRADALEHLADARLHDARPRRRRRPRPSRRRASRPPTST